MYKNQRDSSALQQTGWESFNLFVYTDSQFWFQVFCLFSIHCGFLLLTKLSLHQEIHGNSFPENRLIHINQNVINLHTSNLLKQ